MDGDPFRPVDQIDAGRARPGDPPIPATLGLLDSTVLLGVRALGVPVSNQESADITEVGPLLAQALVSAYTQCHYPHLPALWPRFERERLPWAHAYIAALDSRRCVSSRG